MENLYKTTLYLFDHLKPLFNTKTTSFPQKVSITVENSLKHKAVNHYAIRVYKGNEISKHGYNPERAISERML